MYIKKTEQGLKENHGIQNIGIEDSKGNLIVDKKTGTENSGQLYYRALQSTFLTGKLRR
jgi:hypothetical protein